MDLVFEWDDLKSRRNRMKHGVTFEEAKTVFQDSYLLTYLDDFDPSDEERLISIGISVSYRVLLVVHTEHELQSDTLVIRIISARRATPSERRNYEQDQD